jgi:hypothetical protein
MLENKAVMAPFSFKLLAQVMRHHSVARSVAPARPAGLALGRLQWLLRDPLLLAFGVAKSARSGDVLNVRVVSYAS